MSERFIPKQYTNTPKTPGTTLERRKTTPLEKVIGKITGTRIDDGVIGSHEFDNFPEEIRDIKNNKERNRKAELYVGLVDQMVRAEATRQREQTGKTPDTVTILKQTEEKLKDLLLTLTNIFYERETIENSKDKNPLTKLMDRNGAIKAFNDIQTIEMGENLLGNKTKATAMVRFDIDSFRGYNNIFGHNAGDQALLDVATQLKIVREQLVRSDVLRKTDIVHFSGDEFGLLLTDISPGRDEDDNEKDIHETVHSIVQRAVEEIEKIKGPDGKPITVSAGFKLVDSTIGHTFEELDKSADGAAGDAKALKFIEGCELGSTRIMDLDRQQQTLDEILERTGISKENFPRQKFASQYLASQERLILDAQKLVADGKMPPAALEIYLSSIKNTYSGLRGDQSN